MSRRRFLTLMAGSALAACAPAASPTPLTGPPPRVPRKIRAIAFDLFTIFDPRGVDRRAQSLLGVDAAFATTWKTRLFEYCWIRAASRKYAPFDQLVSDALTYASGVNGVSISPSVRAELEAAFVELEPWPDAPRALHDLEARGVRLAPLANFAPSMIESLLRHAGLRNVFEALISTDRARTYKPDPAAYALAEAEFRLPRQQIAFAAFGGWDAAGAHWFGYPSFWVNRLGVTAEELVPADASGPDLPHLADWTATL